MCCLYLLYFLDDKTVLISLENTEICLPYKFPLKYECLKSAKCGTCTLFQQGRSNKIILSCTSKFTNKFLSNKIFRSLSYLVCLCSLNEVSVHTQTLQFFSVNVYMLYSLACFMLYKNIMLSLMPLYSMLRKWLNCTNCYNEMWGPWTVVSNCVTWQYYHIICLRWNMDKSKSIRLPGWEAWVYRINMLTL